jgi:hypothetical protein
VRRKVYAAYQLQRRTKTSAQESGRGRRRLFARFLLRCKSIYLKTCRRACRFLALLAGSLPQIACSFVASCLNSYRRWSALATIYCLPAMSYALRYAWPMSHSSTAADRILPFYSHSEFRNARRPCVGMRINPIRSGIHLGLLNFHAPSTDIVAKSAIADLSRRPSGTRGFHTLFQLNLMARLLNC